MASPCVVKFCKNIGNHRFPKDELRKAQWIRAIKHVKPGLTIRNNSFICSAHFEPTDFSVTPTHLTKVNPAKVLKRNATPSIFSWNQREDNLLLNQASRQLIFDPSKVKTAYSRTPPVGFIEIPHVSATKVQEVQIEDPLQISEDEPDVENKNCSVSTNTDSLTNQDKRA